MVLEPVLTGRKAPPLSELCAELDIESEAKASNMSVTAKRRFKKALQRRVRHFVTSDEDVETEIRELMEILSKSNAGT